MGPFTLPCPTPMWWEPWVLGGQGRPCGAWWPAIRSLGPVIKCPAVALGLLQHMGVCEGCFGRKVAWRKDLQRLGCCMAPPGGATSRPSKAISSAEPEAGEAYHTRRPTSNGTQQSKACCEQRGLQALPASAASILLGPTEGSLQDSCQLRCAHQGHIHMGCHVSRVQGAQSFIQRLHEILPEK